ncbi:unnamed protein product [Rotaria magnacalcarata]|uniref:Uncharacterized protein n=1 Tax=Rotaria magnacalcarata TaxID=392030 RepID=A0A816VXS4_9BILA|nr:unnamed protein product [Rotaria magnacalcarata]
MFLALMIPYIIAASCIDATLMGVIGNLILSNFNVTVEESSCQTCLCKMFNSTGNNSIVSLNCYVYSGNRVTCQMFTMDMYLNSPAFHMIGNVNSTFYFIQLPSIQESTKIVEAPISSSTTDEVIITTDGMLSTTDKVISTTTSMITSMVSATTTSTTSTKTSATTTTTTKRTTTTSQTTTTTTANLPAACSSYTTISDSTRSVSYSGSSGCDSSSFSSSGMWVRFTGSGGTTIPTYAPGTSVCGTIATGWYASALPSSGATVSGTLCYQWISSTCQMSSSIQVANCNTYYVYFLYPPPGCYLRVCTV